MNEGASLSRFKNTYRLRYCPSAGLEEPPELQPGQNVLSAIQNYFDDSESDIEADTLGIGNTSTPVSEISSRFAVSSKRSSVNPTYRASGNFPTPKSLKSGFQDEKVHRPFTPAHKSQTPSSGNWSNIQKKSLPLVQTEHKGSVSESDSDESRTDVNCGAILLAPGEDATNRAPDVKGPLDLSTKFYKIDGSVMHDHASPTIKLPTKKRLSFRNATLMKEGDFAQDNALKLISQGTKNVAAPVEKTHTVDSLHSTIVPNHPTSHFIQDEEEEEFMINEEDSCVLDTWLGVRESNPQKGESQSKRVAAKSEIPSQIAHGKKDTTVKGKRKYQVQSSAQNNDKPAKEDIPPAKLKRASKPTDVTPDRHLVLSKDEQFGKAANTLMPESRRMTPKGHLHQVGSVDAQQEPSKKVTGFEHSNSNYSDAIYRQGEKPLKEFPEKQTMPESVATSTEHNASSTAYVNKTRSKESIRLPSPASKQRVNKTQLPETPHMPSDRRTIQTSGKTKKSSNLADVTHIVKRPVSSMFLQAATLGNTDSRVPPVLPDPPPTPLVHQDTDDEEFVIDESLFVPNLLVSIPRFGKTNKQLASESEIKRHEKVTDTNQARPIGSDIISNDGYNDKEHVFTEGQMVNSVEDNDTALSEQERPPVEPIECVKSRPGKGDHRNKKPVVQSCEKANESSSSEGEHAMQKKTSAKQKKQKNKKKRNVESVKSRPSKGGPKNKKTLLEPIVQPDENTNDGGSSEGENAMQKKTLTEQRKEKKRKNHEPLKKGGQKKGSSALAPVTALPNESCNEQNDAINVSSKEKHTTELSSTSKKKVLPLSVNNQRLPSANENTLSSQEDEALIKKSKRIKRSSDDEPIPSTSDVRYSGRSQRTHKPPGNWWAVTSPEFDKTLSLRKQSSLKKTQKTSPKKKVKSKRVSVSKQRKKNDKKEAILSELPDSQPIDDASNAKDASPNAVDNSGAKKNQKSQNPHKIVSGDENNIETPHSVVAASQGLPSSKSLGKRKVAEENDNQDEELPLPQKVIKSILKTDTQNSNRPALSKEPILDSMEESEDIISIGKVSSVQHSKTSHVAELRKSIMPGHTQENATNFRSSLASFGDAYIKSPHVQNISGEDCTELRTEEAGSAKKSHKKSGSSQTLKHTPRTRIESAGDEMDEVLNFEDHPLLQLHNKGTPRTEPDKVVIGSGPSLKRSVEFIKHDGIPATSELSDSSEFDDDHRKYNVRQRLVLPSNTPNVRRSRRTRVKPLQYWRGERVNYLSRPSGLVVDGIIPPSEKARGGKSTAKRKHIRKGQAGGDVYEGKVPSGGKRHGTKAVTKTVSEVEDEAEIHVADNTDFQLTDHTTVLDHAKGTEIQVECVRFAEHCVSSTQRDFISVTKALRNSTFSVGKLKLGPLQQKGYQFVCLDTIVFYIIHGLVEVTIHVTNYHLKAGDYFFVPPGNMYNIRNLKSEEAVLIFTQIKGSPMFVEESE